MKEFHKNNPTISMLMTDAMHTIRAREKMFNSLKERKVWNKGLTKETDSRIKAPKTSFKESRHPWNYGLTKETDTRVEKYSNGHSERMKQIWKNKRGIR